MPSRVGEKHRVRVRVKANKAKLALGGRYLLHWLLKDSTTAIPWPENLPLLISL